jgi:hypothetical protein
MLPEQGRVDPPGPSAGSEPERGAARRHGERDAGRLGNGCQQRCRTVSPFTALVIRSVA